MGRGLTRTLARAAARAAGSAPAKSGLSVATTGSGGSYRTVITLTAMAIAVTDALAYASQKIFDFEAGFIRIKGGSASLAFAVTSARASTINDSAAMDWAVGTVQAAIALYSVGSLEVTTLRRAWDPERAGKSACSGDAPISGPLTRRRR